MTPFETPGYLPEEEKAKKFEVKPKPEVPEGGSEQKQKAEKNKPEKNEIKDANGNVIHREEKWYEKDKKPTPETLKGHRQQFFKHDEQGRVVEEQGQALSTKEGDPKHENQWRIVTEWGEGDNRTRIGEIETGLDAGHKWKSSKELVHDFGDGRRIVKQTTEIMEQGQNKEKPAKGSKSEKIQFFKGKRWLGERVTDEKGRETTQFGAGITKLPDWEKEINT
jgi:hypothetical protein